MDDGNESAGAVRRTGGYGSVKDYTDGGGNTDCSDCCGVSGLLLRAEDGTCAVSVCGAGDWERYWYRGSAGTWLFRHNDTCNDTDLYHCRSRAVRRSPEAGDFFRGSSAYVGDCCILVPAGNQRTDTGIRRSWDQSGGWAFDGYPVSDEVRTGGGGSDRNLGRSVCGNFGGSPAWD